MLGHLEVLLPALFDALSAPSDRVVLEALSVQVALPFCAPCPYMGTSYTHEHKHQHEHEATLNLAVISDFTGHAYKLARMAQHGSLS